MLADYVYTLPKTIIKRKRVLPVTGNVLVRKNQRVDPMDVIAEASLKQDHLLLDISRGLGVGKEKAEQLIHFQVGDDIAEGDVVAGPIGLMRRLVRAPATGKVVLVGEGQILLELEKPMYEIRAGMSGLVTSLIPSRGAVVEAVGALVQGVWGNGKIDFGLMQVRAKSPSDRLEVESVGVSLRGSVIVGGYCDDVDVLKKGEEVPIRGMILASMASYLVPLAQEMQYPVVILDGFGALPMNQRAFEILQANDGHEVSLNAALRDRVKGVFPEIVIPLPVVGDERYPEAGMEFRPGQTVRIVRKPAARQIATIQTIYTDMKPLASGIKAPAADVVLADRKVIRVPLANLEVLP